MDQETLERLAIRALVENWVVWRDAGDWERFRTVWHDDGRMMATWFQGSPDGFVAIDGKTLRGSFDAFADRKAAHVLSAFAVDHRIILAHEVVEEKSNEIPAVQSLIETLGLTGRVFTIDAMHCQKNIRDRQGD